MILVVTFGMYSANQFCTCFRTSTESSKRQRTAHLFESHPGNSLGLTATWRLIGHRLCRPRKSSFMDGVVPGGGFGTGKTVRAPVVAALFLALWALPVGHAKSEGAVKDKHGNWETRCETPPGAASETYVPAWWLLVKTWTMPAKADSP